MGKLQQLLIERFKLDSKIRSHRIIAINKIFVLLNRDVKNIDKTLLMLYTKLHHDLGRGMPDYECVDDTIDHIESILDMD